MNSFHKHYKTCKHQFVKGKLLSKYKTCPHPNTDTLNKSSSIFETFQVLSASQYRLVRMCCFCRMALIWTSDCSSTLGCKCEGGFRERGRNGCFELTCSNVQTAFHHLKWVRGLDMKSFMGFPCTVWLSVRRRKKPPCPSNKQHSVQTSFVPMRHCSNSQQL